MAKYRIRIGRAQFDDPHYITAVGDEPRYTSILVNRTPCAWQRLACAEKHLKSLITLYPSAEIEVFDGTQGAPLPFH